MVVHYGNAEPLGIVQSESFERQHPWIRTELSSINKIFKGKWWLLYLIKAYFIRLKFDYDTLNKMKSFLKV